MASYTPQRLPKAVLEDLASQGFIVDGKGKPLSFHCTLAWNYHLGLWESTDTVVNRALMAAQWKWNEQQRRLGNGSENP